MKDLTEYLRKFQRIIFSGEEESKIISQEINKILGLDIKAGDLDLRDGVVFLKTKPIIKSEVFINKVKILEALSQRGIAIKDLR